MCMRRCILGRILFQISVKYETHDRQDSACSNSNANVCTMEVLSNQPDVQNSWLALLVDLWYLNKLLPGCLLYAKLFLKRTLSLAFIYFFI